MFFLKDYAGLDVADTAITVEWMVSTLIAGLRDRGLRRMLGRPEETG